MQAVTVAATDINDNYAANSNHGPCVDIAAPGMGITTTWLNGGTATLSGSSMATPHVAGAAALLLSAETLTPTEVAQRLQDEATAGVLNNVPANTVNLLLCVDCA